MHYKWGHGTANNLKPGLAYFISIISPYQSEIGLISSAVLLLSATLWDYQLLIKEHF